MNEQNFIKWYLEVTNQEYNGDLKLFRVNLALNNFLEG